MTKLITKERELLTATLEFVFAATIPKNFYEVMRIYHAVDYFLQLLSPLNWNEKTIVSPFFNSCVLKPVFVYVRMVQHD